MKPSKTLELALLNVAEKLETDSTRYNWYFADSCVCGLLAQELLGIEPGELIYKIQHETQGFSGWGSNSRADICQATGLPLSDLFQELLEHGLEQKDFGRLELLRSEEKLDHHNPLHVATFFRQLAHENRLLQLAQRTSVTQQILSETANSGS